MRRLSVVLFLAAGCTVPASTGPSPPAPREEPVRSLVKVGDDATRAWRIQAAVDAYEGALGLDASHAPALMGSALALARGEEFPRALERADRLVAVLQSSSRALLVRGVVNALAGNDRRAREDLDRAVATSGDHECSAIAVRAELRRQHGDLEGCIADHERAAKCYSHPVCTAINRELATHSIGNWAIMLVGPPLGGNHPKGPLERARACLAKRDEALALLARYGSVVITPENVRQIHDAAIRIRELAVSSDHAATKRLAEGFLAQRRDAMAAALATNARGALTRREHALAYNDARAALSLAPAAEARAILEVLAVEAAAFVARARTHTEAGEIFHARELLDEARRFDPSAGLDLERRLTDAFELRRPTHVLVLEPRLEAERLTVGFALGNGEGEAVPAPGIARFMFGDLTREVAVTTRSYVRHERGGHIFKLELDREELGPLPDELDVEVSFTFARYELAGVRPHGKSSEYRSSLRPRR